MDCSAGGCRPAFGQACVSGSQTARGSQPGPRGGPLRTEPAGPGRRRFPPGRAVYIGAQLPRPRRPRVISHRFLPRRRGSAFLRLEQQLSPRRRLGPGQRAASPAGPPKGVRAGSPVPPPGPAGRGGAQRPSPSRPLCEAGLAPGGCVGLTLALTLQLVQADRPAWRPAPGEHAGLRFIFHSSSEDCF